MLALLLPLAGQAMWAELSDEALIEASALIVIGEWVGQSTIGLAGDRQPLELGAIAVREVLKGDPHTLALVSTTVPGGLRSSSDLHFRTGDQGLWFLRPAPGDEAIAQGVYLADHPQRFIAASGAGERIEQFRRLIAASQPRQPPAPR